MKNTLSMLSAVAAVLGLVLTFNSCEKVEHKIDKEEHKHAPQPAPVHPAEPAPAPAAGPAATHPAQPAHH